MDDELHVPHDSRNPFPTFDVTRSGIWVFTKGVDDQPYRPLLMAVQGTDQQILAAMYVPDSSEPEDAGDEVFEGFFARVKRQFENRLACCVDAWGERVPPPAECPTLFDACCELSQWFEKMYVRGEAEEPMDISDLPELGEGGEPPA